MFHANCPIRLAPGGRNTDSCNKTSQRAQRSSGQCKHCFFSTFLVRFFNCFFQTFPEKGPQFQWFFLRSCSHQTFSKACTSLFPTTRDVQRFLQWSRDFQNFFSLSCIGRGSFHTRKKRQSRHHEFPTKKWHQGAAINSSFPLQNSVRRYTTSFGFRPKTKPQQNHCTQTSQDPRGQHRMQIQRCDFSARLSPEFSQGKAVLVTIIKGNLLPFVTPCFQERCRTGENNFSVHQKTQQKKISCFCNVDMKLAMQCNAVLPWTNSDQYCWLSRVRCAESLPSSPPSRPMIFLVAEMICCAIGAGMLLA